MQPETNRGQMTNHKGCERLYKLTEQNHTQVNLVKTENAGLNLKVLQFCGSISFVALYVQLFW